MSAVRAKGELTRTFLIENIETHPADIVRLAADKFACSRQAIHKHLQRLIAEGAVVMSGQTRNKTYRLAPLVEWRQPFELHASLSEDAVWRTELSPRMGSLPDNVRRIWQHGFTEMFNNVIDHSGAKVVLLSLTRTAARTHLSIYDDGVGIFKKIQNALGLEDARHAVLELAKGKFTTDPARHSGEGIFFSSRMFDRFEIFSGEVYFSHDFGNKEDWILDTSSPGGTYVQMDLHNHTSRTVKKVFDEFTADEAYGFSKTVVPVRLMRYGDDSLVSRSQAKRLLTRFDRFKVIVLDFSGVEMIGQSFADEVFRVFQNEHPEIEIDPINASSEVRQMISRAKTHRG